MIFEEKVLDISLSPRISEKSSFLMEKNNVVVFNVDKRSTKLDIKNIVEKLFSVNVCDVHTVNTKKKVKKGNRNTSKRRIWKKAYVTLKSGQKIDFQNK